MSAKKVCQIFYKSQAGIFPSLTPLPTFSLHDLAPFPRCYSTEAGLFHRLATSKHIPSTLHSLLFIIPLIVSLVFNQYFPLYPPLHFFVSSCLITPIFLAAPSFALHLSASESCRPRDIKGRSGFLSQRSSHLPGPALPLDQVPSGEDPLSHTLHLSGAASLHLKKRTHKSCHMHRQNVGNTYQEERCD